MTECGVAVEEVAFFSDSKPGVYLAVGDMHNPDVWHEARVTWSSLGDDHFSLLAMTMMWVSWLERARGPCG